MNDGSIYEGYQVDKIKKGIVFKPNASNLYEYNVGRRQSAQPFGFNKWINPTNLPPLNLTVPDMTPEEEIEAALVRKVNNIQNICGNNEMSAEGKLNMIRNLLDPNVL